VYGVFRCLQCIVGVGNEMECELLMWRGTERVHWYSFVWRRGTVPLWWKSELKSQVQAAPSLWFVQLMKRQQQQVVRESEVIIRDNPYEHSEKYWSSLLDRYGHHPIILFNMLRCGPKQEEMILSEVYLYTSSHLCTYIQSLVVLTLSHCSTIKSH
jgi:hypothetical protein